MRVDPRLANLTVLVLAAKRRQAARQTTGWEHTEGLAALLEAARDLPRREPWALPDLEEQTGLARLVLEARRWAEDRRGA